MKSKTIRQTVLFDSSPSEIFGALMDSKKHSAFTGAKAVIGKKVGDEFSVFDDYTHGINLRLVPNKKIVQTWRASEPEWEGYPDSTVSFELAKTKAGTKLTFVHRGVPEAIYSSIKQGWTDFYWKPLKAFLKKKK